MKPQVESSHYFNKAYDTKVRFISYWHQINEILKLKFESVLEIGIGNGFVSKYLKERDVNITTLDFDSKLNPDIVGDVLNIPFADNSFNVVACYEVLEHLPFEKFNRALAEIFRVSDSYAILSLPDASKVYRLFIQIPILGVFRKLISLPQLKRPAHIFDGEHYWEIGKDDCSLNKIIEGIAQSGFVVKSTYRLFEYPYHRFFVLKKILKS